MRSHRAELDFAGGGRSAASQRAVDPLAALLGESAPMQQLRASITAAAETASTVLLCGETGTGKGVAARAIHGASARRDAPFVHVDCACLSSNLIESELFGHERGAFTGATERRRGRFESAGGGTLFLDEIGELDPRLQAKLLRVLQDREFERIGGTRTLSMSARIVAATNRDLARAVRQRRFRADLYFRLKVVYICAPPLRDRTSDVPRLVDAALARLSSGPDRRRPRIRPCFWQAASGYAWPGNVRELSNFVEQLLVNGSDPWCGEHVAELLEGGSAEELDFTMPEQQTHAAHDRDRVAAALAETGGNVARAARRLKLPRSTLRYRIAKYRLEHRPVGAGSR
jgi:transcriptional regulator with GAF, ATPase, and Fis domain